MTNESDDYYDKLSNAHIENLRKEFYARYSNDGAYDLIEKAFALGCEMGYDIAKTKFTNIFMNFQNALNNEND